MFSNRGLFKHIICPAGAACKVPNCIFSHEFPGSDSRNAPEASASAVKPAISANDSHQEKRRRLVNGDETSSIETKAFVGSLVSQQSGTTNKKKEARPAPPKDIDSPAKGLKTAQRIVSPPPKAELLKHKAAPAAKPKDVKKESLNPRHLPNPPAQWGIRTKLLEALHGMMVPLNKQAKESSDPHLKALHLDDNALIRAALDEEEKIAKTHGKVYSNMIKLRIAAYKKMKTEDWKKHMLEIRATADGVPPPPKEGPPSPPIETGLAPEQETRFLSRLVTPQEGLEKHGYVTVVPSEAEIEQAKAGVVAGAGWEQCERCSTRFQVFPDRREDGALTSGKQCAYHWGKLIRPAYKKTEAITGRAEPTYECCRELAGTPGCTVLNTHVFKISEGKRLAAVLPFVATPANPNARADRAVTFDCEMGYTVYGLELIRLTATSWPDGAPLIDVLVRPLGAILDLNTRFSGVSPEMFLSSLDFKPDDPLPLAEPRAKSTKQPELRIVSSPVQARDLLLSHISPETPLIGHAIENDLNAVRLVHPTIIDTTALYPHPRGLPFRLGLRNLSKQFLNRSIQTAGAAGHDSLEDARATGDLVRVKVAKDWTKLKNEGWTVTEEGFCPPVPLGSTEAPKPAPLPLLGPRVLGKDAKNKKRHQSEVDEADEIEGARDA